MLSRHSEMDKTGYLLNLTITFKKALLHIINTQRPVSRGSHKYSYSDALFFT